MMSKMKLGPIIFRSAFCALITVLVIQTGCARNKKALPRDQVLQKIEHLKNNIEEVVDDSDRAAAMIQVLDRADQQVLKFTDSAVSRRESLVATSRDYNATRADLEIILKKIDEDMANILKTLETAHFEMKALASADEWAEIVKKDKKFLGLF